jgi:hypothetical protein
MSASRVETVPCTSRNVDLKLCSEERCRAVRARRAPVSTTPDTSETVGTTPDSSGDGQRKESSGQVCFNLVNCYSFLNSEINSEMFFLNFASLRESKVAKQQKS